jgi:hypothetical protein
VFLGIDLGTSGLAPVQRRFEPDPAAADALLERHARFVSLFEAVRGRRS